MAWRRRPASGATTFALLMVFDGVWLLGYTLELATISLPVKLFWNGVKYIGVVALAPLWLVFALQYTGILRRPTRGKLAALLAIPALTLALVWTNRWHHLIHPWITLSWMNGLLILQTSLGPAWWVHMVYSYGLMLIGTILLISALLREPSGYHLQTIVLLVGSVGSWIGNMLDILQIRPLPALNFTPFVLTFVTGPCMIWCLGRLHLLNVMPIARDAVLEGMQDGIIILDSQGRVVDLNPAAQAITGVGNMRAREMAPEKAFTAWPELAAFCRSEDDSQHDLTIQNGNVIQTLEVRRSSIRDSWNQVRGTFLILRNVTERVRAQEMLQKAHDDLERRVAERTAELQTANESLEEAMAEHERTQAALQRMDKLEALGTLAGGIAHDFNNMLAGIVGSITMARMEANIPEPVDTALAQAEHAALEARGLTHQLLAFSRGSEPIKTITDMKSLILNAVNFALRGSNVRAQFELAPDLLPALIDQGQIDQVINNLVINAKEAMPDGGVVTVSAVNADAETAPYPLPHGRYIKISIHDQGPGIPVQLQQKIFDPYFSTKSRGSGLGLTSSSAIINRHGGHLWVVSTPGQGAVFSFVLPAAPRTAARHHDPDETIPMGTGAILLLEDEATVSTVIQSMLKRIGYLVTATHDGTEAVQIWQEAQAAGKPFDLGILDLTIPGGMGGAETARQLRTIDPHALLVASSGYSTEAVMARYTEYGFDSILAKPYTISDLALTLNRLLTARRSTVVPPK